MPEPSLQALALRYAAGDLPPDETTAFEWQLACDQQAREALAEVIRLSAQALGQTPPKPHSCFRHLTRARLNLAAYRGHPLVWSGLGALLAATGIVAAISFWEPPQQPPAAVPAVAAGHSAPRDVWPPPREPDLRPLEGMTAHEPSATDDQLTAESCGDEQQLAIAELWAEWSRLETVDKSPRNLLRRRQLTPEIESPTAPAEPPRQTEAADSP